MIHNRVRPLRKVVPLVLAALLVISGCLPSDLIPKPLPSIIKVGLVAPFEGSYRYVGYDAVYAARLAVREINAAGGVAGWQLELVAYDDRGEAALAAQIAEDLVIDPDVAAVIGHYRPDTSASAGSVYADAGLPNIVIGDVTSSSPMSWYLAPPPADVAAAMVTVGLASHPESAVVWADASSPDAVAEIVRSYLVDHEMLPVADADAAQVFSFLGPVDAASRFVELRSGGGMGLLVGNENLAATAFLAAGGAIISGTQFVTPYPWPQDLARTQAWIDAYLAMGPHVPNPGPYALPTYEAVHLIAAALDPVLDEARSALRGALGQSVDDVIRDGSMGEIRWAADRYWMSMPLYHYRWTQAGAQLVQELP